MDKDECEQVDSERSEARGRRRSGGLTARRGLETKFSLICPARDNLNTQLHLHTVDALLFNYHLSPNSLAKRKMILQRKRCFWFQNLRSHFCVNKDRQKEISINFRSSLHNPHIGSLFFFLSEISLYSCLSIDHRLSALSKQYKVYLWFLKSSVSSFFPTFGPTLLSHLL